MLKPNAPIESAARLRALKRRIYLWALAAGILATLAGWGARVFGGTFTPYERVIFPIMTGVCLGLFIALWRTPRASEWVEFVIVGGTGFSLLGRLVEILLTPVTIGQPANLAALADLLYWFPLVYVLAFLIFENSRRLLISNLIFFATLLVVGLGYTVRQWQVVGALPEIFVLVRFYLANAIYIVLLAASMRLNEQYIRVRTLTETMTRLAHTDPLIHIANRRELEAALAREISRATRQHQPLTAISFDIDRFKQVNDTYGHETGDAVLKEVACAVQGLLRATDLLGRWGGDEFLIIAPQTTAAQAGRLAERLRQGLDALVLEHVSRITGSFGVAEYGPLELSAAWLKRSDEALYAAKQGGRNQVATAA